MSLARSHFGSKSFFCFRCSVIASIIVHIPFIVATMSSDDPMHTDRQMSNIAILVAGSEALHWNQVCNMLIAQSKTWTSVGVADALPPDLARGFVSQEQIVPIQTSFAK